MGVHNRITRDKYQQIKADCKTPKDYQRVMRKYHISKTTVKCIHNSENYDFYRQWVAGKIHKNLVDVEPPRIHVKPEVHKAQKPAGLDQEIKITLREILIIALVTLCGITMTTMVVKLLGELAR